jgi:hypothetical protein
LKLRILGWVLLIVVGVGTIISAWIGSDWPMYAFIIVSSGRVAILSCFVKRCKKHSVP